MNMNFIYIFLTYVSCHFQVSAKTARFIRELTFIGSASSYDVDMTFSSCTMRCFMDSTCASYLFSDSGHCKSLPYVLPLGGSVRTDYSYFLTEKVFNPIKFVYEFGSSEIMDFSEAHKCVKTGYSYSGQYDLCYKAHQEKIKYDQSRSKCEDEGAKLLRIDNPSKQAFVETELSVPAVPEKYRIDGSLDNDTKIWSYADGTPISVFHWHPNEPHDDVSRHLCIGLRVAYGLLWDDVFCNNKWGYICEKTIT